MNARLLFVLLVVGALLALVPRYRRAGLTLCAAMVALLIWVSIREAAAPEQTDKQPNVSATTGTPTSKPRAQLGVMQLEGRGAPWRLRGSVQNLSDTPIHSVSLNIERYDCPTSSTVQADCTLLWQGVHVVQVSIGAFGSVNIDESFYSHVALPIQTRVIRDRITIAEVA